MALAVEKLGTVHRGSPVSVDPARARAYAEATNDENPAYRSGLVAPPLFGAVAAWDALSAAVAGFLPAQWWPRVLHAEHDMHFHRPLGIGMRLVSEAEPYSVRPSRTGARFTVLLRSTDIDTGCRVLDQFATMFVRGLTGGEAAGPDKPDHAFPDDARGASIAEHTVPVDADQTFRYAKASGDHNPIHVDDAVARSLGLEGIVVHGLCAMAMAGRSVLEAVAGGSPESLRRLSVRFSRPVFPGAELTTTVYEAPSTPSPGRRYYLFESHSCCRLVMADGRAEVEG